MTTTTAMPELPEPELGYIETNKSRQPAFSARQMRAAMQAQPAEVSDATINRLVYEHTKLNPNQADDLDLLLGFRKAVRAILALRPQAVPMDQEAAWEASPVTSDWEAVDAYMQGIADTEAHHGITAHGTQGGES